MPIVKPKIIVIDDDPTGSQTVHSCPLLLRWDVKTLRLGLRDAAPILFILANTRALTEPEAIATTTEVCQNLKIALEQENIQEYLIVSRSDSTLRGHFPAETEAIAKVLGPFDACFFAPAFFEGGRITRNGIHYVRENERLIPVAETEFAGDRLFGFQDSFLPDFIATKTQDAVTAAQVDCLSPGNLPDDNLQDYFCRLRDGKYVVLDGEQQADFDRLVPALFQAIHQGKKFLFRSAASLLTSLADLGPQPIPPEESFTVRRSPKPGLIIVGSHTQKTTVQLAELLQLKSIVGIEIDVELCQTSQGRDQLEAVILEQIPKIRQAGQTPVLFTSRQAIASDQAQYNLEFGQNITTLFLELLAQLPADLGFMISKGGNTTNALLQKGLRVPVIQLLGQIIPGCCLVQTEHEHPQFPQLPVVLFPGNVGDRHSLVTAYQRLQIPS
ncbi:Hrp-dependent type III effector protein [Picosynechococcus sp. PCC 7003]|uniref:four-carbon acid sugar kinase family protein n=1 Tax=Picosynechococcus sp. PCC 7003 TaxID=374981 RepID=UPI0008104A31|nr:four-carbon acid sugar kinase family protein [Picosynechococcus sp. PCC 7003]ANV83570.1 Hrp-dependent type III effector protein [Picosynechococcus sp. PCC 7003]